MARKKKEEPVIDVKGAKEKLGPELIEKIAEKEWKTALLPTEEELAQEEHKSPKARTSPNSRKNLIQYQTDKPKEAKEKIVKALQFQQKRVDVNPFDYIKLPEDYLRHNVVSFLPDRKVMKDADEEIYFYTVLNAFLSDFDLDELSSSDMEDIISLAVNRILENRLLALTATDPNLLMDASTTIEKFRKHSSGVKNNLASRRSDRIDPKNKQNFSIVDIVNAYDDRKRDEFNDRIQSLKDERKDYLDKKK